ncbi:MAG: hypothetical protein AAF570_11610, partial [Bacteroidota bacterium]
GPLHEFILEPAKLPKDNSALWFVLSRIREAVRHDTLFDANGNEFSPETIEAFLRYLPQEHRFALIAGLVWKWGEIGGAPAMFDALKQATGLER